jgi:hypothetical protein
MQLVNLTNLPIVDQITGNSVQNATSAYVEVNNELSQLSGLPQVFQNIGLALLTILIPLAIAVLTEVYKERGTLNEKKKPFVDLDLHVILDYIFKIKWLVVYSLMMFLPFAFWEAWGGMLRLFLVIVSGIGICLTFQIVLNVYKWTKSNIFSEIFTFRFSYLEKTKNLVDLVDVWKSVWSCENIDYRNERAFFAIFSKRINEILLSSKNDARALSTLIEDFSRSVENRSSFFLAYDVKMFSEILEWYFSVWKSLKNSLTKEHVSDDFVYWHMLTESLKIVINAVAKSNLEQHTTVVFFSGLQKHIVAHRKEQIEIKNITHYYLQDLFRVIFPFLFGKMSDSLQSYQLWEDVPNEWKVTVGNINNKENLESKILLDAFLDRFLQDLNNADTSLFNRGVLAKLFPDVEPRKWAIILLFSFSLGDNKAELTITQDWSIVASAYRITIYTTDDPNEIRAQDEARETAETRNTYELVYLVSYLKAVFTKENLNRYIKDAEDLSYPAESKEEHHKQALLGILREMLAYLETVQPAKENV